MIIMYPILGSLLLAIPHTSTPKFLFLLLADPRTPTFFIELPGLLSNVDAGREPLCLDANLPEASL